VEAPLWDRAAAPASPLANILLMTVKVVTLGGLSGYRDAVALEWFTGHWLRAGFLVYVAVERSAPRESLQTLFWPDCTSATAAHRLNQTLYALRRSLGAGCLETRGRHVRAGESLEVDGRAFEQAVVEGRICEAVSLYGGSFLDGEHLVPTTGFETWVDATRAHYGRLFRSACRKGVAERFADGDYDDAVSLARAWVAADMLDDEAQHRLIEVSAAGGHRSEAIRQYEFYTRLIAAEGLVPLDETESLIARVRQGERVSPRSLHLPLVAAREARPPVLLPLHARAPAGAAVAALPPVLTAEPLPPPLLALSAPEPGPVPTNEPQVRYGITFLLTALLALALGMVLGAC
jgi:DNA-binding SARP family transcriptional activator